MSLVALRHELEDRGWDCPVMNLNENRRVRSPEYIDVQSGWDYLNKVWRHVSRGYAVQVRVNAESKKGYLLALTALLLARFWRRPALLTFCGGHVQTFFPAPKGSLRFFAFALLFRVPTRIYCNSLPVKQALLTTGIAAQRILPIPAFSPRYVQFAPVELPNVVSDFLSRHQGVFFLYICYRKEYMLDLVAEVLRRFRAQHPTVGFLLVGTGKRELDSVRDFFASHGLADAVCITGSVPHDVFLTMMTRSLACIRTPLMDGVASSVLEALSLRVPVLGSDNGTRPPGVELWSPEDPETLLRLMSEALHDRDAMSARIPSFSAEDNTCKLADDLEMICGGSSSSKTAGSHCDSVVRS